MAVALALGLRPGGAAVALGSTTTVLAGLEQPIMDATGGVRSRADATGRHLAVATASGGGVLIGAIGQLLDLHPEELGALALAAGPDDAGPVLVPGVPGRDGGVLTGLRSGTTRAGLARAAFDGLACAALDAADQIVDAGADLDDGQPLRLTGPEAGLDAHAQVLATLADRPVVAARPGSLAAAGACVQAAAVLTGEAPEVVADAWDLGGGPTVEPEDDPTRLARRLANADERSRQRRALLDPL
jgi:xylulokinase